MGTFSGASIDEYFKLGASKGIDFSKLLLDARNRGATIPMDMENVYRGVFDAAGGIAPSYESAVPTLGAMPDEFNVGVPKTGAKAYSNVADKYNKNVFEPGYNSITGDKDASIIQNILGGVSPKGNKFSGIAGPAMNAYSAISTAMLGRDALEATKENNAAKLALIEEDNRRKAIDQKNLIRQSRRYGQLAMGNSNNQGATMATVNRNPYSTY